MIQTERPFCLDPDLSVQPAKPSSAACSNQHGSQDRSQAEQPVVRHHMLTVAGYRVLTGLLMGAVRVLAPELQT
eukprot:scaffold34409_cov61-Phaeocystis_antarctica.AAC.3